MTADDDEHPFKKGRLVASFIAKGIKPRKAIVAFDEELSLMTRAEAKELYDRLILHELADPDTDPEFRRELLSNLDVCPCCQRWLGHNRPPADDDDPPYRRQTSFDFNR